MPPDPASSDAEPPDPAPPDPAHAGPVPQVVDLVADPADAIARAVEVLVGGGTAVLPTDTVYGLAASASVPGATARLFALKGRGDDHPLAVLVADVEQALELMAAPGDRVRSWMAEHWPGPLTIVLRRSAGAGSLELGGVDTTIGIRCPAHDAVRSLARQIGPLATTSANLHGRPTPATAAEAATALAGPVDLVLDGGPAGSVASTVVDVTGDPRILRAGALDPARLGLATP